MKTITNDNLVLLARFYEKLLARKESLDSKFITGPFNTTYVKDESTMSLLYKARLNSTLEGIKYMECVFSLLSVKVDIKSKGTLYFSTEAYEGDYVAAVGGYLNTVNFADKKQTKLFVSHVMDTIVQTETVVARLWASSKQVAYVCWYAVRISYNCVKAGLVWLWDNTIGRLFKKPEVVAVVAEVSETSVMTVESVIETVVETVEVTETVEVVAEVVETVSIVVTEEILISEPSLEEMEEAFASIPDFSDEVVEAIEDTEAEQYEPLVPFVWNSVVDDEYSTRATIASQYAPSAIAQKQDVESFAKQHGITVRVAEIVLNNAAIVIAADAEYEASIAFTPNTLPLDTPVVQALEVLGSIPTTVAEVKTVKGSSYNKKNKKAKGSNVNNKGKA